MHTIFIYDDWFSWYIGIASAVRDMQPILYTAIDCLLCAE